MPRRTEEQKEARRRKNAERTEEQREEERAKARERRAADPEKARERNRVWVAKNRERSRELNRRWWAKSTPDQRATKLKNHQKWDSNLTPEQKEERRAASRKWHAENPELAREISLKSRYGVTKAQFDTMFAGQGMACAICRKTPEPRGKRGPVIDHCHATGAIRGILCGTCNLGLGFFSDDPDTLRQAIVYLRTHATGLAVPNRKSR